MKTPKPPKMPEPPPPPNFDDAAARARESARKRAGAGQRSTLLTGPLGATGTANTTRTTLLGG